MLYITKNCGSEDHILVALEFENKRSWTAVSEQLGKLAPDAMGFVPRPMPVGCLYLDVGQRDLTGVNAEKSDRAALIERYGGCKEAQLHGMTSIL